MKQTHSSCGNVLKSHLCSKMVLKKLLSTNTSTLIDKLSIVRTITFKNQGNTDRNAHEEDYK